LNIGITIKNYRCFPEDTPASIRLEKGFTALVGSNNSGKSSLLKFFWEFRPLLHELSNPNALRPALQGGRAGLNLPNTIRDPEEVFWNRQGRTIAIEFDLSQDDKKLPSSRDSITRLVVDIDRVGRTWGAKASVGDHALPKDDLAWRTREGRELMVHGGQEVADITPLLSVFRELTKIIYIPAYRNAINLGAAQAYFDIQTGQAFISQWRAWQAGDIIEHRRAARRLTDAVRDIFGYERLEVVPANNNETLELFIDGESFMLPELGAGIAQFFMVLANAAIKNPPFVLIDEPELNLHPSLQRAFLRCLATFTTEGVLFATHNLGLALAQADRTYSVQRLAQGRSTVHRYGETPRLSEFLGELSFAGYKELGFDKVLLVEGVTDLRAMQFFLSLYGKQDKIVLLHLGGGAMINGNRKEELQEVQRICPHVHALIDSEKTSLTDPLEAKRQAFVDTCAHLSPPISCKAFDRRGLENYFTDSALKTALGHNVSALGPYDRAPKTWKVDNWRIAQEMQRADIAATDLGSFLDSL
jgi:energy-coupling factor transporter ATP-binding protein EcfA2